MFKRVLFFTYGLAAYLVLEEKDLLDEQGAAYQEYRRAVPMLLPTGRGVRAHALTAAKTGAATAIGLLVVLSSFPVSIVAEDQHSHSTDASALVAVVREATERFKDVAAAEAAGFELQFGCVSGPDWGAMGLHYVHFPRVLDGELDARQPEIVIYEPLPNGTPRLIGADYLVLADAWHKNHANPPQLMGQLLHLIEAPNRFGLPTFYTLHVWAWKDNPGGTFANWHKNVSCDSFGGDSTQ